MIISRYEALKAVDDIFNYCEEIDNSLPENERSGYKMLPDIHKIRKYIIDNERPHGRWICISLLDDYVYVKCSECGQGTRLFRDSKNEFCCIRDVRDKIVACPYCGADMRNRGDGE